MKGQRIPDAALAYIEKHIDEWPSVLAFKIGRMFKCTCGKRAVAERIRQFKREASL